jgi:hypothetical protein
MHYIVRYIKRGYVVFQCEHDKDWDVRVGIDLALAGGYGIEVEWVE